MPEVLDYLCEAFALFQDQGDSWSVEQQQLRANVLNIFVCSSWKDDDLVQVHQMKSIFN